MEVKQLVWEKDHWVGIEKIEGFKPQLCLLFGSREELERNTKYRSDLKESFPESKIVISSTAGNIVEDVLADNNIVASLLRFEYTAVKTKLIKFGEKSAFDLGIELAKEIDDEKTAYALVLSCSGINADDLLKGFNSIVKGRVPLSGGIAGDDYKFERTVVGLDEDINDNQLVSIVFIGDRLQTFHGSQGGWDTFGPERIVTKSKGNVLFEIDGKPALQLYKDYLGERSSELPTSALHFPLAIIDPLSNRYIVRGVQNIDESTNSMVLYGDVSTGDTIQLMKANIDRVIQGAEDSASQSRSSSLGDPDFSMVISCVARRLVLDQLVEEELSAARTVLGNKTPMSGFYSYSELSPLTGDNACHLHNQTMTITSFYER